MPRVLIVLALLAVMAGCSTPSNNTDIPPAGVDSTAAAPDTTQQ